MACFSRDVLKWLQSLDLSWQIKTPKWDFANGYLVAEVLFWYFSREISPHSFVNGNSLELKLKNWDLLKEFFCRHQFRIPEELIDGTIHCKEDAAILLVNHLYEILTHKSPLVCCTGKLDDSEYQQSLSLHARSTAAKALKSNLRSTELVTEQDLVTNRQKASALLQRHAEHRARERREQPARFERQMAPGERCLRRHPGPQREAAAAGAGYVNDDEGGEMAAATAVQRRRSPLGGATATGGSGAPEDATRAPVDPMQSPQNQLEISVKQQSKYAH